MATIVFTILSCRKVVFYRAQLFIIVILNVWLIMEMHKEFTEHGDTFGL